MGILDFGRWLRFEKRNQEPQMAALKSIEKWIDCGGTDVEFNPMDGWMTQVHACFSHL